jgi:hypothetical protein
VRVHFGDGTPRVFGSDVRHAYAAGSYRIMATAVDRAGNTTVVTRRLTVR